MRLRSLAAAALAAGLAACGDTPASSVGDPATATLATAGGNDQATMVGTAFSQPFTVRVSDAAGHTLAGIQVGFATTAGSVNPATATTDATGTARATWTAPTHPGVFTLTATLVTGHSSVDMTGRVMVGAPSSVTALVTGTLRGGVGDTLRPAVRVTDAFGNAVAGVDVAWQANGGSVPVSSRTDSSGVATAAWALPGTVGMTAATASVAGVASLTFSALARPAVRGIDPAPFASGDTVRVHGRGLAAVEVSLAGTATTVLSASDTLLAFVAPATLPSCADPLPRVAVRLTHPQATFDTTVTSFGRSLAAPDRVGAHAILPAAGSAGCPLTLPGGTYGLALYRVFGAEEQIDTVGRPYVVHVNAAGPAQSPIQLQARAPALQPEPTPVPDVHVPSHELGPRAAQAACVRAALAVDDTITILDYADRPTAYRVAAVSPRVQWLLTSGQIDSLSAYARGRFAAVVDSTERQLMPFLMQAFGFLPDSDGDGRLNVVMGSADVGGQFRGFYRYASGCRAGDFIYLAWPAAYAQLTGASSTGTIMAGGIVYVLAHEATHWIDFSARNGFLYPEQSWSIEGFATLGESMWLARYSGGSLWTTRDLPGSFSFGPNPGDRILSRCWPPGPRVGGDLNRGGQYYTGCSWLLYLLDQRMADGADPASLIRLLMPRGTHGDLLPLWTRLGGTGRSEAELAGEFLLALYADDYAPGASTRLQVPQFNFHLPQGPARTYPFPRTSVQVAGPQDIQLKLGTPDGSVIELRIPPGGATVTVTDPAPGYSMGLVRRE